MSFSVSVASAILFIAASVVFSVLFGSMVSFQNNVDHAQRIEMQRMLEAKGTDMTISAVDTDNHTITVVNTGSAVLDLRDVDVLVNGTVSGIMSIRVMDHNGSNIWSPGESVQIETTSDLVGARIKVVAENGIGAYW